MIKKDRNQISSPLFSVVIPAYNAEQFIERSLLSVINQTFKDYEIIIVNDGSTDQTEERVRRFFLQNTYIQWKLINQHNKGIGGARNAGILNATGEYVAFLDADDIWYANKLDKVADFLKSNPEIDFVCHDEIWVKNGEKIKSVKYGPYKSYEELLFKGNCISTSASVIRRGKILDAGLFSEDLAFNGVEDYDLWLRLAKICKIEYLHEVLGEYHIHGSGITSDIPKHTRNSLNVLNYHFSLWPKKTLIYKYLMNKRQSDVLRNAGRNFIKTDDYALAKKYLISAIIKHPLSIKNIISVFSYYLRIKF